MSDTDNRNSGYIIFSLNNNPATAKLVTGIKEVLEVKGEVFRSESIDRYKDQSIGATARDNIDQIMFGFYIPNDELKSDPPFKGRIMIIKNKNGNLSRDDSFAWDAYCVFNSY
jgi:hypothetical protein